MSKPWPTFFVLGAEKAGTTSLYHYLTQHPSIFMPTEKEPGFFSLDWDRATEPEETIHATWGPIETEPSLTLEEATREYLALYEDARAPQRGDATASYLWHPKAPERIEAKIEDPRFVVLARDPVERAYSHYLMAYRNGAEEHDFLEALERDLEREGTDGQAPRRYVLSGRYSELIRRYTARFGEESLHVGFTEHMAEHPRDVLGDVCELLDVPRDPIEAIRLDERRNTFKKPRNRIAHWLRTSDTVRGVAQRVIPESLREVLGNQVLLSEGEKPEMSSEARVFLEDVYRDEADELAGLTGLRPPWDWA